MTQEPKSPQGGAQEPGEGLVAECCEVVRIAEEIIRPAQELCGRMLSKALARRGIETGVNTPGGAG